MRKFYSALLYLSTPLILAKLILRSRKSPAYRLRILERFGFSDIQDNYKNAICVHAVSVGETLTAVPLIRAIKEKYPKIPIIVTTMTVTGSERVKAVLGDSVFHVYMPYDLPFAIKRFLKKIKPRLLIIMETELWPNLLHYCKKYKIPTLVANARLSERSANNYYRFKTFTKKMLNNINIVAAQSDLDAKRFQKLGMPSERIKVTGNIKFDISTQASVVESAELLRQKLGANRPVWIAASTREGEEEQILHAFEKVKSKFKDCLLILVPRHPERFLQVLNLCRRKNYQVVLRSEGKSCSDDTDIFFGDSMGELMLFYAASDVAFVGGSLANTGGHNLLEPAIFSLPIIAGPHLFNFTRVAELLKSSNAITIVDNKDQLAAAVINFLSNTDLAYKIGKRAQAVVFENRGAVKKHLNLVVKLLKSQ